MKIVPIDGGISIVPETDFETDYLANCFIGKNDRKVIAKSGMSVGDLMSIDVTAKPDKHAEDCSQYAVNCLKNLVKES